MPGNRDKMIEASVKSLDRLKASYKWDFLTGPEKDQVFDYWKAKAGPEWEHYRFKTISENIMSLGGLKLINEFLLKRLNQISAA